jgi:hypothetical protein
MKDVRICFDVLLEEYPSLDSHISTTSSIVYSEDFENGIVSLQKGNSQVLNNQEKEAMECFKISATTPTVNVDTESKVLLALRMNRVNSRGHYVDTTGICPTSNHLERLFSQCKLIKSQLRQAMAPETLEMLLFLKVNRHLWSVLDVEAALNSWTGQDLIVTDPETDVDEA